MRIILAHRTTMSGLDQLHIVFLVRDRSFSFACPTLPHRLPLNMNWKHSGQLFHCDHCADHIDKKALLWWFASMPHQYYDVLMELCGAGAYITSMWLTFIYFGSLLDVGGMAGAAHFCFLAHICGRSLCSAALWAMYEQIVSSRRHSRMLAHRR